MTDRAAEPPEVFLLQRGDHRTPGDKVEPAPLGVSERQPCDTRDRETPRRHAFYRATAGLGPLADDSGFPLRGVGGPRAGQSGLAAPLRHRAWCRPAKTWASAAVRRLIRSCLEYLALQLAGDGWRMKDLHRLILRSAVYRQTSTLNETAHCVDPDNRLLWRKSLHGSTPKASAMRCWPPAANWTTRLGGPYVPTNRNDAGRSGHRWRRTPGDVDVRCTCSSGAPRRSACWVCSTPRPWCSTAWNGPCRPFRCNR